MEEYIYRFAFEGENWTYSNSPLANVLTRAQRMSRTAPTKELLIQRVKVKDLENCFVVKCGNIQKGGNI